MLHIVHPSPRLSVLLVDSSPEVQDLLEQYLSSQAFNVTSTSLMSLLGRRDPAAWIRSINPDVVVFEISIPYDGTAAFCETLRGDARLRVPFVLTTTNRSAVERLTPVRDAIEVVGIPYDLAHVRTAILNAAGVPRDVTAPDRDRREAERRAGDRRHVDRREEPQPDGSGAGALT